MTKPQQSEEIRLLLVDDHEIVRLGLRTLFEQTEHIHVVGEADTAALAVSLTLTLKPTVVLMDIRLPDASGIEACRRILAACRDAKVLMLTSYADEDALLATVSAGAHGFLLKQSDGQGVIRAVETVAGGYSILDPALTNPLLERLSRLVTQKAPGEKEILTPQEKRVLALVAEGQTNKEIATALSLSEKTVKNYLSSVFQKLQVRRRSEAVALFLQEGGRLTTSKLRES